MSPQQAELRAAIARLNYLFQLLEQMAAKITSLEQQLRDARGG